MDKIESEKKTFHHLRLVRKKVSAMNIQMNINGAEQIFLALQNNGVDFLNNNLSLIMNHLMTAHHVCTHMFHLLVKDKFK